VNLNFSHGCCTTKRASIGGPSHGSLKLKLTIAFVSAAMLVALTGGPAQGQKAGAKNAAASAGNADSGKQLFASAGCAACHGASAKGMSSLGPQITPPPLAIPEFVDFVRHPTGAMKPFSTEELSDAQLGDIYAFLQSLSPSSNSDSSASSAPAGNSDNGKRLYVADGCYECHGYVGQGGSGSGPKLGPHPILFSAYVAQIRHPRAEMPPYTNKVVSDADLADIYAFLQSLPAAPKAESVPLLK